MGSNTNASGWSACLNNADGMVVVSCTITGNGVSGVGLILNTSDGKTLASAYTELSGTCTSASPSLNLASGDLKEGDTVLVAADGEADGEHFFFEEKLSIGTC
jgi:hypothetical protein